MKSNPEIKSISNSWSEVTIRLPSEKLHLLDEIMQLCFIGKSPPLIYEVKEKILMHSFLREKYSISSLAIFGSVARGTARPSSDIDILVTFNNPPGLSQLYLHEELQEMLGWPVDLMTVSALRERFVDPAAQNLISKEAIYVWKNEHYDVC